MRPQLQCAAFSTSSPSLSIYKRGKCARACSIPQRPSLLSVPGIGKRALDRLQKASVESVSELCDLYVEEHGRSKESLVKYLKDLGIHSRWTSTIADWIDKETQASKRPSVTFCVEGNVGAGKSTWLDMVRSDGRDVSLSGLHEVIEVVPEPVSSWQSLQTGNLLELFYKNPQKYAFAFQQYVLITRMQQEKQSRDSGAALRLIERSVFCDRMVFVRAVHALKQLNEVELEIYDSWFNPMLDWQPQLVPDGFVYLKTDAETCARRIEMRQRQEEAGVPLDYLERLHGLHDKWLVGGGNFVRNAHHGMVLGQPTAVTPNTLFPAGQGQTNMAGAALHMQDLAMPDPEQLTIPPLPEMLQGNVVLLDRERLKDKCDVAATTRLHLVPALHVDCIDDINITDPEVIAHRSQVMHEYRSWVQLYQKANRGVLSRLRSLHQSVDKMTAVPRMPNIGNMPSGSLEILADLAQHA
eukprot:jgi/Ulvmu1/10530/UM064_0068.1